MPHGGGKGKGVKKKRRASMASVKREIRITTDPSGTTFTGRWPGIQKNSEKKSFEQRRTRQVLRQISTAIFGYVREELDMKAEQEVQAMLVNDRILISANDDGTIDALALHLKKKAKKVAHDEYRNEFGNVLKGEWVQKTRELRTAKKLGAVLRRKRLADHHAANLLRAMARAKKCIKVLDLSTDDAGIVTSPDGDEKVILVKGSPLPHAEQKLVHALFKAYLGGYAGRVYVYGKKRPCYGCYLTLKYVEEHGFPDLWFNSRAGGTWFPPVEDAIRHAEIFGTNRADIAEWFEEEAKKGYTAWKSGANDDTAHDSESDSDSD